LQPGHKLALGEAPEPKLQEHDDVILKVTTAAICGTDVHVKHGQFPGIPPGTIMGHEFVGVVEEVGKDVCRFKPGERLVQKDLARTLRIVADRGFDVCYTGEVGMAMTRAVNATGPVWGRDDLAKYEAIVIDDLGYVQQSREEMEVLFTLLAERYERGSVMITSNLPFSKWEAIFKDPMTTASAIDRRRGSP
jgi:hypothetical protein